jgi:hypothetical protein
MLAWAVAGATVPPPVVPDVATCDCLKARFLKRQGPSDHRVNEKCIRVDQARDCGRQTAPASGEARMKKVLRNYA